MAAAPDATVNKTARLAGALYLAIVPFSAFGLLYVPSVLYVPGDATETAGAVLASEGLFRSGIVSHLIAEVLLLFVVLALYRLLKIVKPGLAQVMVVLVLVAVPMSCLNEVNQLAALEVLRNTADAAFSTTQRHAQAMLLLQSYQSGILLTQIFWGLWLLPLGALVFRSGFLPKPLGVLVVIAGVGYVLDCVTQLLFQDVPTISKFTFIGELLLPLWLLVRGVSVERWQHLAVAQAPGMARPN